MSAPPVHLDHSLPVAEPSQRLALANEVHARTSDALETPSRATHVAALIDVFRGDGPAGP